MDMEQLVETIHASSSDPSSSVKQSIHARGREGWYVHQLLGATGGFFYVVYRREVDDTKPPVEGSLRLRML